MFEPPRCPNPDCRRHRHPRPDFYWRNGYYHARCRPHPVPRFRCRTCGKGFSRQTFRQDYRDHRPDLNAWLFILLASGIGLRQSARILGLSRRCTELKFRKIARHLRALNLNLRGPLPPDASLQLDEFETYEGSRGTRPLTVPVLIERDSRFVIWAESAPIRPKGRMNDARRRAIARDEEKHGRRPDRSRRSLRRTLRRGARLAKDLTRVVLDTDEKSSYPGLAREAFGAERLEHRCTNSRLARGTWNPLFPINHTEAMLRDLMSRLRRRSWLVSKLGWCLDLHLQLFMAYRNYVRRRFNYDPKTPAEHVGVVDQQVPPQRLLSWRQDWGRRSVHPLARRYESVAEWRCRQG